LCQIYHNENQQFGGPGTPKNMLLACSNAARAEHYSNHFQPCSWSAPCGRTLVPTTCPPINWGLAVPSCSSPTTSPYSLVSPNASPLPSNSASSPSKVTGFPGGRQLSPNQHFLGSDFSPNTTPESPNFASSPGQTYGSPGFTSLRLHDQASPGFVFSSPESSGLPSHSVHDFSSTHQLSPYAQFYPRFAFSPNSTYASPSFASFPNQANGCTPQLSPLIPPSPKSVRSTSPNSAHPEDPMPSTSSIDPCPCHTFFHRYLSVQREYCVDGKTNQFVARLIVQVREGTGDEISITVIADGPELELHFVHKNGRKCVIQLDPHELDEIHFLWSPSLTIDSSVIAFGRAYSIELGTRHEISLERLMRPDPILVYSMSLPHV
ncbi:hypothetical protein PMAYCL1PPCAC_25795, partial [Pristionchus mayeri]